MHLSFLPLLLSLAPILSASSSFQAPIVNLYPQQNSPQPFRSTTVDVIAADPELSIFLRYLQRARLIPALNSLPNGSTVFAPVNLAFHKVALDDPSEWTQPDNILHELRQNLLYHILNYTFPPPTEDSVGDSDKDGDNSAPGSDPLELPFPSDTSIPLNLETLLYPDDLPPQNGTKPPPASPWVPLPVGGLGSEGQRLRGFKRDGQDWIGVDWQGKGGFKVLGEGVPAGNGIVWKVDGLVDMPKNIAETIQTHPSLTYLRALLHQPVSPAPSAPYLELFERQPSLTVFAPSDTAWSKLPRIERTYLESGFAGPDIELILGSHLAKSGVEESLDGTVKVGWREAFEQTGSGKLKMIGGEETIVSLGISGEMKVRVGSDKNKRQVFEVSEPDLLCKNGVVHIVDDLLIPAGALKLTTEKTLIGLNATRFVSLLRLSNLTSYINSTTRASPAYTILAPLDPETFSSLTCLHMNTPECSASLEHTQSLEFRNRLKFHILHGRQELGDLKDGMLIETVFASEAMGGRNQVIKVGVRKGLEDVQGKIAQAGGSKSIWVDSSNNDGSDNNNHQGGWSEVTFSGVPVEPKPIESPSDQSLIYLLPPGSVIEPPEDIIQTALTDLSLSVFIGALISTSLSHDLKSYADGLTILAPRNVAFEQLGLVIKYLLLPEAKAELKDVLGFHVLKDVVYLEDAKRWDGQGKKRETWTGEELEIRARNGSIAVGSGEQGGKAEIILDESDMIISNGVIHQINEVQFPPSANITLSKILRGSKSTAIITDLLIQANMSWILDGSSPSTEDLAELGIAGWSYGRDRALSSLSPLSRSSASFDDRESGDSDDQDDEQETGPVSFTLLAPTDEAFSHLNLTRYTHDRSLLIDLLKLHIIPSHAPIPLTPRVASHSSLSFLPAITDGKPLSIKPDVAYLTLLSASSKYGDVAFGANPDGSGCRVGIKGARLGGGDGEEENDWASLGAFGRGTPSWPSSTYSPRDRLFTIVEANRNIRSRRPNQTNGLSNGVHPGGGVIILGAVLVPYKPSWWIVWSWTILGAVVGGSAGLTILSLGGWWLWQRRAREGTDYERLENEED
ncbi:Fasciclin and related adhesion glycoproteins [Phaffia rhodozyma]|uniref:Fasciclin and related adhesion glycoproteins n=1 Tax=Phaffia rhodozyma TaxID=264483 RepID=A0A0F7SEG2_PHARH|nr:Fasciclin and related adhesion glycoproteins [Phaffia rhodozyma]